MDVSTSRRGRQNTEDRSATSVSKLPLTPKTMAAAYSFDCDLTSSGKESVDVAGGEASGFHSEDRNSRESSNTTCVKHYSPMKAVAEVVANV